MQEFDAYVCTLQGKAAVAAAAAFPRRLPSCGAPCAEASIERLLKGSVLKEMPGAPESGGPGHVRRADRRQLL